MNILESVNNLIEETSSLLGNATASGAKDARSAINNVSKNTLRIAGLAILGLGAGGSYLLKKDKKDN